MIDIFGEEVVMKKEKLGGNMEGNLKLDNIQKALV